MLESAGDYVFDELSTEEHLNYRVLVKCLKHRFHKVESAKTYATMFWKRDQKASETEETYAAKLKHIYGKAYPKHDNSAQDEDLLYRFLNGLLDQKAHQQIEFIKDPTNIDDALDGIVKYCETHQSLSDGQHHVKATHTNPVETEGSDVSVGSKDEQTVELLMLQNLSTRIKRSAQCS